MWSAARLAVVGDFGSDGPAEAAVAALVDGWDADAAAGPLDAVLTVGDNNYPTGEWATIDRNVGQYYSRYIGHYRGAYGPGAAVNRFFPAVGNHDWDSTVDSDGDGVTGLDPYLDYFTLPQGTPGNERYYDVVAGPVHVFVVDSDAREPDGRSATSPQAQWLQQRMAASTAAWQVVVVHHPPYASAGGDATMRWPFAQWGADLVLAGHVHTYERLEAGGLTYVVNGVGGRQVQAPGTSPAPESRFSYGGDYGAQLIEATDATLTVRFERAGYLTPSPAVVDQFTLTRPDAPPAVQAVVVNDGGAQRSMVTGLTVTFDRPVTPGAGAFALAGRNGAGAGTVVSAANPLGDGRTWVLTFSGSPVVAGSLADGVYDLTVVASKVRAAGGGPAMAADYGFAFHRLFSDADGDGDSDNADLFQMRSTYTKAAGDAAFRPYFDCDGSGVVDNADLFQVRGRRSITFVSY